MNYNLFYYAVGAILSILLLGVTVWIDSLLPAKCKSPKMRRCIRANIVLSTILTVINISTGMCAYNCEKHKVGLNTYLLFILSAVNFTTFIFCMIILNNKDKEHCISKEQSSNVGLWLGIIGFLMFAWSGVSFAFVFYNVRQKIKEGSSEAAKRKLKVQKEQEFLEQERKRQIKKYQQAEPEEDDDLSDQRKRELVNQARREVLKEEQKKKRRKKEKEDRLRRAALNRSVRYKRRDASPLLEEPDYDNTPANVGSIKLDRPKRVNREEKNRQYDIKPEDENTTNRLLMRKSKPSRITTVEELIAGNNRKGKILSLAPPKRQNKKLRIRSR